MAAMNFDKDQVSALMGGLAQAVMAPTRDGNKSWQSGVGALGQSMGQAGILGKQADAQRAEQRALLQMILGGGGATKTPAAATPQAPKLTPDGVAGPTSKTYTQNADGTFVETVKGNEPSPGVNAPIQPPPAPTAQPKTGGFSLRDVLPFWSALGGK